MSNSNPTGSGLSVTMKVFDTWFAVLVPTFLLLVAPTSMADELICDVSESHGSHQYLVAIDDDSGTVTVADPKTNKAMPITVVELTPERAVLGFNSLALNATEFIRQGRIVSLPLTLNRATVVDRSTNQIVEAGFVTDDEDKMVALEQIRSMKAEEESYQRNHKKGPSHPPIFWTMIEAAIFQYEGTCTPAVRRPGS
jgi:hypothetical protein